MDLSRIKVEDWLIFAKKYPGALSFLEGRALWNEYHHLKSIPAEMMNEWQEKRFQELDVWYENISKGGME